jgi:hypothetical protein
MCHIARESDTHPLIFTILRMNNSLPKLQFFFNHNDFANKPVINIQQSILVFSIGAI